MEALRHHAASFVVGTLLRESRCDLRPRHHYSPKPQRTMRPRDSYSLEPCSTVRPQSFTHSTPIRRRLPTSFWQRALPHCAAPSIYTSAALLSPKQPCGPVVIALPSTRFSLTQQCDLKSCALWEGYMLSLAVTTACAVHEVAPQRGRLQSQPRETHISSDKLLI